MSKKNVALQEFFAEVDFLVAGNDISTREAVRRAFNLFTVSFNGVNGSGYYDQQSLRRYYYAFKQGKLKENIQPTSTIPNPATVAPEDEKPVEEILQEDIKIRRLEAKARESERRYKAALAALEEAEHRYDVLVQIKEPVDIIDITPSKDESKSSATAIVLLSDWHFEETVEGSTINNINNYNLKIAERRWFNCIQRSLRLIQKERHSDNVDTLILWLGGDFITGYIHEELMETNSLSPIQATLFAKEKIITALNFYLQYGGFKEIIVVCNYGNHGRTTQKIRVSSGYKNSYEWGMYHDVQAYFKNESTFQFVIPNGLFAYVKQYGKLLRFWHGDNIKYNGGVGGLTIPLRKAIMEMDKSFKADFNFMGHYHTFYEATQNCQVNGSGIGYGPYAQRINAPSEPPMQGFRMLHSKYGFTVKMPIYCD